MSTSITPPKKKSRLRKWIWRTTIMGFVLMNLVAFFHAYKFTHFTESSVAKTKEAQHLSFSEKMRTLLFGINNPRPENRKKPDTAFQTIFLQSNKKLECWDIPFSGTNARGSVILFHGYGGSKSAMLDKAKIFRALGYHTFLVDFMGSGGSEGNQTTIGFKEAEQVKTCYEFIQNRGEKNLYLFGTSMGAVAIMKCIADQGIKPQGIILECPFGSMYKTTCARFKVAKVPAFPMAGLLVFWGGVQNGFWAFSHRPESYAKYIHCPVLLMHGAQDPKVSSEEIDAIFKNLGGPKTRKIYPRAGHDDYLKMYKEAWTADLQVFLEAKEE